MNGKLSLFAIVAILIIPIVLYTVFKSPADTSGLTMAATDKPTVLKFSSPLCMECKELEKLVNSIKPKYKDKISFQSINVNSGDAAIQQQVKKYEVQVVPTMVFLDKKGQVIKKTEGCPEKGELEKILNGME